ncbi:MAG: hypothetical protein SPG61_04840 [Arcanobacterium sp.]|nr:hypothetical protein [Arcanobacterium sp.]
MTETENIESGESLIQILDEITELVTNAKSMPLSASVLVNRGELLDMLELAREIVPSQIVAADSVLRDIDRVNDDAKDEADRIIARAEENAEQIIAQAKNEAQRLVSQDAVTVSAKSQATKIIDEAKSKADRTIAGANDYSDGTLEELAEQIIAVQEHLDQIQAQIEAGREVLADRREIAAEYISDSPEED